MWAQTLSGPFRFEQVEVLAPDPADLPAGHVLLATRAGAICGSDLPNFRGGLGRTRRPRTDGGSPGRRAFPCTRSSGRSSPAPTPTTPPATWSSAGRPCSTASPSSWSPTATASPATTPACRPPPRSCCSPWPASSYAVEHSATSSGQTAAVIGQGPIGLLFSHVLKARGAARVTGVDPVDRSDVAAAFGVDETVTARAERWAAALLGRRPAVRGRGGGRPPDLDAAAGPGRRGARRSALLLRRPG